MCCQIIQRSSFKTVSYLLSLASQIQRQVICQGAIRSSTEITPQDNNLKGGTNMGVTMIVFWAVAFVVFLIAEIATLNALVSVWFAVGALASMLSVIFFDLSFVWQLGIFVIVSTFVLIITRPLVRKIQGKTVATNYELDVSKPAVVIEPINNQLGQGRVKLDGVDWSARSENGELIEEGTIVTVKVVDGSKLIVSK